MTIRLHNLNDMSMSIHFTFMTISLHNLNEMSVTTRLHNTHSDNTHDFNDNTLA